MPLRPRITLSEGSRYGIVLLLLACGVIFTIISPAGAWSAVLTVGFQGAAVLTALSRPATSNVLRTLVSGEILASVALAATATNSVAQGLSGLVNAGVVLALPVIIVLRFRQNLYVNLQSVLGAICIYLVIGIIYANLEFALSHLTGEPFFTGAPQATRSEYMYFSMVTLSTVGYGDLTAGTGGGRALAVSEALLGQLYLVTVIALLVSNFGRTREPRPGGGAR